MKKEVTNEFKDGLNLDLNPIVTPNTVLTDNLNGTFITYNGNEFCLQNDRGNIEKASLTEGYIPIGIKERNGILYIVSVRDLADYSDPETTEPIWATEIGYFPNQDNRYERLKVIADETSEDGRAYFTDVVGLNYDPQHPITIEIQDSYDGSVNLILVDNKNPIRIVNTGFSKEGDNYTILNRKQIVATNIYDLDNISDQLELIRNNNTITNIDLLKVISGGQFKGGNYTFYLKFGDADYNQTDVVTESGIVSIFKGNDGIPSTISGTLLDERTDKMINLRITGLNTVYSKLYIYYTREYSDTQGYRMTESGMFIDPIDIRDDRTDEEKDLESESFCDPYQDIWLSGFEQTQPINIEELNVDYHTIDWARAESQHSNMLFLGNIGQKEVFELYKTLQEYSLNNISTKITYGDPIDKVGYDYTAGEDLDTRAEYYNTKNIYYRLGYWPDEYYRFGIVYILEDGSTTPVFNMYGGTFTSLENTIDASSADSNKYGVFKTPNVEILSQEELKPLCFNFTLNGELNNPKVTGYFIVRQKRIPITICQGLSIGIDKTSKTPLTWDGSDWISESFLAYDRSESAKNTEQKPELVYNEFTVGTAGTDTDYENYILIDSKSYSTGDTYNNRTLSTPDDIKSAINSEFVWWVTTNLTSQNDITEILHNGESYSDVNYAIVDGIYSASYMIFVRNESIQNGDTTTINKRYYVVFSDNASFQWDGTYNGTKISYVPQSFSDSELHKFIFQSDSSIEGSGLLSLDPCVNSSVGSCLDGSQFEVRKEYTCTSSREGLLITNNIETFESNISESNRCIYVAPRTNMKVVDEFAFSTVIGDGTSTAISLQSIKSANTEYLVNHFDSNTDAGLSKYDGGVSYSTIVGKNQERTYMNINLLRGYFAPFVGMGCTLTSNDIGIYSIRNKDTDFAINIREQDNSPFYCVSNRFKLSNNEVDVYRGDCFTNTISFRMQTNFVDDTAPVANMIVAPLSWYKYVVLPAILTNRKWDYPVDPTQINLSDVNTVSLGYWTTFKCLSSYNLGLRSVDSFHTDEMALLGSPRSFYPLNGASTATGNKMEESFLLNDGYSATVGEKRYNLLPDTPYSKSEFANRIMFSNVHITDAFTNGYRTFQGLSYKDYDKQYGAITKLLTYGQNLLVVMEHGIGLVPVNPKALIQTTTGEAIHIYGHGVLPDEMTIISQDYGSKYEHSVVRTPIGIYGIDVDAKKIWRFSDKQGFETFSDMKIETLLKDCLESVNVEMSINDVRTHYNAFKGDLMFTWYVTKQISEGEAAKYIWNICYNERQNVWVTRYGWVPIISENINDSFYSLQYDETIQDDIVRIWSHTPDSKLELPDPTNWYNRQHGFEFEFVVSDPIGINKIFDNLQIISNNTQPNELEISIIGDSYMDKRSSIIPSGERKWDTAINTQTVRTTSNIHPGAIYGTFKYDWRLNEILLVKLQEFKDIYKFGRRIGNIHYKDGVWYSNIEPIILRRDENDPGKQARIRDKWARIRIRYTGEDMAVITAIKTLINI